MIEKIKIIIKYILKREGDSNRLREDTAPGNSDDSFFFYLGFLSRAFMIHRTAGEGRGYLFNSSLPLATASWALRH